MMKRLIALLLALTAALSLTGALAESDEAEAAEQLVSDTLLATVNGAELRENDQMLQENYASMLAQVQDTDAEEDQRVARMYAMRNTLVSMLIIEKANAEFDEAARENFRKNLREEWAGIVDDFTAQSGVAEDASEEEKTAARADTLAMLESEYGMTEDMFVETYLETEMYNAYIEKVSADLSASDPELSAVSDEEAQKYYLEQIVAGEQNAIGNDVKLYEQYQSYYGYEFHYIPEGYRGITHILLKVDQALLDAWTDLKARYEESQTPETEQTAPAADAEATEAPAETAEPVTAEMVEAARQAILDSQKEKIDEIMARLDKGESFEDLIAEYGEDPGMTNPEYLKNGYSVHPDSMSFADAFTKGAAALEKVGDVSEPVISDHGIHILHYLRDVPAGPVEMDEAMAEEVKAAILEEKLNLALSAQADKWLQEADIVWTEAGEAWKFDQAAVDAYLQSLYAEEEPAGAEPAAETPAEEPAPEETPAG